MKTETFFKTGRKLLVSLLAVLMLVSCIGVASMADAEPRAAASAAADVFRISDGYILGSYSSDGDFIEIKVNGHGAGAAIGSVEIKFPAADPGAYAIDVYVNGEMAFQQTVQAPEVQPEPTAKPEPTVKPDVPSGDVFRYSDGYITGCYTAADAFIEIKVNEHGSGVGIGSVEIKVPASETGEYVVDVYVNGALAYAQTIVVPEPEPIPTAEPVPPTVIISEDGATAQAGGDYEGLYVRIAIALELHDESGLYITQGDIGEDGVIVLPAFSVPGLTVTGVSVALVSTLEDITSPSPDPVAQDFVLF